MAILTADLFQGLLGMGSSIKVGMGSLVILRGLRRDAPVRRQDKVASQGTR